MINVAPTDMFFPGQRRPGYHGTGSRRMGPQSVQGCYRQGRQPGNVRSFLIVLECTPRSTAYLSHTATTRR